MVFVRFLMSSFLFFFNDTATTEIYTLSLHDALPISSWSPPRSAASSSTTSRRPPGAIGRCRAPPSSRRTIPRCCSRTLGWRSEEHTSELQSQSNLVCRLLLEKKKKNNQHTPTQRYHN